MYARFAMPQAVTLPIFGSASNQNQTSSSAEATQSVATGEWQIDSGNDPMDFDLLAEYLLEDSTTTGSSAGLNFDFNGESTNTASAVSSEQSVDVGAAHENRVIRSQQMIPQHGAGTQHQKQIRHNRPGHQAASSARPPPAPLAPAPPPHANTPSPLVAQPAMVGAQVISVSTGATYMQQATHIAPAPSSLVGAGGLNTGVIQQPNTVVAKRRRIDNPGSGGGNQTVADPMAVAAALQGRGRKKTQAQIDRRRERNRILARRTRLRKKFFFESLQKEVVDLQRENAALKDIVRTQLSEDGKNLLDECDAMERMPPTVFEACGENADEYDQQDFNLVRSIQQSQHSFVITDPSLQDNPIVFASDDFLNLTGYSREDVLGRNCRFLQGTETSQAKVDEVRKGLANGDDISVTMVNYKADGTPFWNKLFIAALRDAQSNIVNFIGVVVEVPNPEPDDPEYGKKLPLDDDFEGDGTASDSGDYEAAPPSDGIVEAMGDVADTIIAAAPAVQG